MKAYKLYKDGVAILSCDDIEVLRYYIQKEAVPYGKFSDRRKVKVENTYEKILCSYPVRTTTYMIAPSRMHTTNHKQPDDNIVLGYN